MLYGPYERRSPYNQKNESLGAVPGLSFLLPKILPEPVPDGNLCTVREAAASLLPPDNRPLLYPTMGNLMDRR